MPLTSHSPLTVLAFGLLYSTAALPLAWAQVNGPPLQPPVVLSGSRPMASAARITQPPVIDGTLDEDVWQAATPLTRFTQAEPLEGEPGSESTEVRIVYDDEALYIGVVLHDRNPSLIVTT